jgi:hypothetical protein
LRVFTTYLFIFLSLSLCAQHEMLASDIKKKKIILIPYSRFELHSDVAIETIASINDVNPNDVYGLYASTLQNAFWNLKNDSIMFITLSEEDFSTFSKRVFYEYQKQKPPHYAVDLSRVDNTYFNSILTKYDAAEFVFINMYQIKRAKKSAPVAGKKTSYKYSNHIIHFDVIGKDRKQIYGEGNLYINLENPDVRDIKTMHLKKETLLKAYTKLAIYIVGKL